MYFLTHLAIAVLPLTTLHIGLVSKEVLEMKIKMHIHNTAQHTTYIQPCPYTPSNSSFAPDSSVHGLSFQRSTENEQKLHIHNTTQHTMHLFNHAHTHLFNHAHTHLAKAVLPLSPLRMGLVSKEVLKMNKNLHIHNTAQHTTYPTMPIHT